MIPPHSSLSVEQSLSKETLRTLFSSIKVTIIVLFFILSIFITISISLKSKTTTEGIQQSYIHTMGEIDEQIRFFGHNFTMSEWKAKKQYLHNLFGLGHWIDAWDNEGYQVPYINPCIDVVKYKWGKCLESNPNQGRRFAWKPDSGTLQPWSSYKMCEIMNGKNLLIAGDSLSEEFFFSILSSLWANLLVSTNGNTSDAAWEKAKSSLQHNCLEFCHDWYAACTGPVEVSCGDFPSFKVGYARTDNLYTGDYNWVSQVEAQNASVLIMNTGAHYEEIHEEVRIVNSSLGYLKARFPELSILYRTTIAGHVDCDALFNSEPLKNIPDQSHSNPLFHWTDIRNRSLVLQNLIERYIDN